MRADQFLRRWAEENVDVTDWQNFVASPEVLAVRCEKDAKDQNLTEEALRRAAGGNLKGYMARELTRAVDREAKRLCRAPEPSHRGEQSQHSNHKSINSAGALHDAAESFGTE